MTADINAIIDRLMYPAGTDFPVKDTAALIKAYREMEADRDAWKDAAFLSDNEAYSSVPVDEMRERAERAEARIAALEAALGEAERALEPLASASYRDHEHDSAKMPIRIGNLRAARTAITKIKETRNAE